MSIHRASEYHPDGRMAGCFVYMLLCDHASMIYIKVGMTARLSDRLQHLRLACPFMPRIFAFVEVATRGRAAKLEKDLHEALTGWHSHGEWFAVGESERQRFNAAWRPVLERHSDASRRLEWQQVSVDLVAREGRRRMRYRQHLHTTQTRISRRHKKTE